MTIKQWLDSKERDYDQGVKLYADHPTAMRGLVTNLNRKRNALMEEKLAYVLEKAHAADQEGSTESLKKKETAKPAPKKKGKGKQKPVTEKPTLTPEMTEKPTLTPEMTEKPTLTPEPETPTTPIVNRQS